MILHEVFLKKKTYTRWKWPRSRSGSMYRYQFHFRQFWCNHLFSFAIFLALGGFGNPNKTQMKSYFLEVATTKKINLGGVTEKPSQKHIQVERVIEFVDDCIVDSEEQDLSIQFLQMQKNQIFDSQEHFERYCNVLPIFAFNSTIYDINLIKSYVLPIFLSKRVINRQL